MSDQWIRKCVLVVSAGGKGLDLSQMRIVFKTFQSDARTPNHAIIRVYNLSDDTAQRVQREFTDVTLQAGYENGHFGVIFKGTIKQVRRGRINATDTYTDVLAADGDLAYTQAVINKSIARATATDQRDAARQAMNIPNGYVADLPQSALSRGKVLFGMAGDTLSTVADTAGMTWSIQGGELVMIGLTSYRPGEAVVLNSATGLIGLPEQTEAGISVRCLLNSNLRIGSLVRIDNASVQRAFLGPEFLFTPGRLEDVKGFQPKIADDGYYRIYCCEFDGDTRGAPWYANLICLAVDKSAPPDKSVKVAG